MSAGAGFAGAGAGAFLALEDGTVFRGESVGADGQRVRRGRLHDRDDRLPGDRHRPELRRADRLLHGADGRQLRRRRGAAPSRPASHATAVVMREARGPEWTDWLRERGVVALDGIDTRSLVLHLRDRGAMRAARSRRRGDEATRRGAGEPAMEGAALVAGVSTPEPYVYAEDGRRAGRGRRLRDKRSILRRLAGAGAAVDGLSAHVDADSSPRYDGVAALERPGRPGAARRGDAVVRDLLGRVPGARHLPRPPAARRSRPATRPSSSPSATAARTIPVLERADGPRARHLAEPRLRGRADRATPRRPHVSLYDGTVEGFDFPELTRAVGAVPPRGGPGPARRLADPRELGRGAARCRVGD